MTNNNIISSNSSTTTVTKLAYAPIPSTSTKLAGGSQACAACKFQRRKCILGCLLAPFFPAHHQKQFLNVHKLFGVKKITKTLEPLQPFDRQNAVDSMVIHANLREADPVGGCYRIISDTQKQIDYCQAELRLVTHQLELCKAAAAVQESRLFVNNNGELSNCYGVDYGVMMNLEHGFSDFSSFSSPMLEPKGSFEFRNKIMLTEDVEQLKQPKPEEEEEKDAKVNATSLVALITEE